ncbi:MAG: DeoR/GlpR family DNA-binding transcription regulator [Anaerolineales bacterium]|jgi:DeoR family transcriptional regulator of aga operon/DeoR family fructose operon transcriptional repressor
MEISTVLFPVERQQQILAHLNRNGRVSVSELSQIFGVSEVTIRADLQTLTAAGLILRTHGGAMLAPRAPELSLTLRRQQQVDAKERIGAAAAEFVANGDAVFLDASSTALALAHVLHQRRDLTVLTHSLVVAQSMLDASGVTVVMTGGTLQRETVSLMGTDGLAILRKYNLKTGFFGAHGLSFPEGLTDVSAGEAEVKRQVVALCRQVIALIDATKWGRVGPASFARPEDLHVIITDAQAPSELVEQARVLGTRVMLV